MKKILWLLPFIAFSLRGSEAKTVDRILVQVNDEIITLSELNREMAQARKELASKYTGEKLEEMLQKAEKQILETLIQEKLLYQKAVELGFGANVDSRITAYIQQLMKENNIKDTDELSTALEQQGVTLRDFREQIKKRIMRDDLVNEFVRSRITLLTPEIEKYYKDHAVEFTTPEEVTLSEIIAASQGDDKAAESRANDLVDRIRKGESFASLASQYSSGPTANKGGSIGTYVLAKLNPDTVTAIANVKEGDISKPQKVKEGYIIYRVDKRKPSYVRPLDEVRDEIKDQLFQRKFVPELERYISQLREEAYVQFFSEIK
jgi:peptidyl-prolyl cis-trans isomerase SurA